MQARKANLSCAEIGTHGARSPIGRQDFTFEEIRTLTDEICFAESIFFRVPEDSLRQSPKRPRVGLIHSKKGQFERNEIQYQPKSSPFLSIFSQSHGDRTYARH